MLVFPYLFQLSHDNRSALANSDQRTHPDQGGRLEQGVGGVSDKSAVGVDLCVTLC
jgi:hypothetical protein